MSVNGKHKKQLLNVNMNVGTPISLLGLQFKDLFYIKRSLANSRIRGFAEYALHLMLKL